VEGAYSNLSRTAVIEEGHQKSKRLSYMAKLTGTGEIKHAAPSEVARWVSAAWKAIPESIIVRSCKKCCISNALDVSEDDIVWEDNVEDKDDTDWVESTDNDSVMSDDGKSDNKLR
jgi:hypothetical protein